MRLIFLFCFISCIYCCAQSGHSVVFDISHRQASSPFDTGFAGLSQYALLLKSLGCSVSVSDVSLDILIAEYPISLLVIGPGIYSQYTDSELHALNIFIESGGSILAVSEHDNIYKNADFHNILTTQYGIHISEKNATEAVIPMIPRIWPTCRSDYFDLEQVIVFYSAALNISPPAQPVLYVLNPEITSLKNTGALTSFKKGNIAVLGDYEILWNMTKTTGIRLKKNRCFVEKLSQKLLKKTCDTSIFKNEHGVRKAVFVTESGCLRPDSSASGLRKFAEYLSKKNFSVSISTEKTDYSLYDLAIIACPLEKLSEDILNAKKILAVADGLSDMMCQNNRAFLQFMQMFHDMQYTPVEYDYPLNTITRKYGFFFLPATIASSADNPLFHCTALSRDSQEIKLCRAAPIICDSHTSDFSIIASSTMNSCAAYTLSPPVSDGPQFNNPAESPQSYPICIASETILAVSDIEQLSNLHFNENNPVIQEFSHWIENPSYPSNKNH